MVIDIYSQAFAYRTDTFPNEAPSSWADFWNVEKFPGRRGLVREAEVMEQALLADGVLPADLFPLDMDRALRKLDEIKPHITTWWTSGAQTSQFLVTGELDLCSCYNGRAQVAIDEGAPVRIVWNQASLIEHGWSVPKGGPKTELARQFVKFCARADRQAAYTDYLPYGPTNPKSYDFISPEIAAKLPTEPGRVDLTYKGDAAWWAANKEEAHERFEAWLMG
jgi:putative spermidine/putrescine transport system substrate-binding protein